MKISKKQVLFALILASTSAFAETKSESSFFVDVGYTGLTYKEDANSFSPSAVRVTVGKNEGNNFGYEGLLAIGAGSDTKLVSGTSVKLSIPTIYGLYAKGYINPSDNIELFGRFGFAGISTKVVGNSTATSSGSGLSYGVGVKFVITKDVKLTADYMTYYPTKNAVSLSGYTLGASFGF